MSVDSEIQKQSRKTKAELDVLDKEIRQFRKSGTGTVTVIAVVLIVMLFILAMMLIMSFG